MVSPVRVAQRDGDSRSQPPLTKGSSPSAARRFERKFRTVVDKMGMGDGVVPYNEAAEGATRAVYNAFGMADMLKVKA